MDRGTAVNITAQGDVTTADCVLLGFYVNNTSTGQIVLRKGGSSGTVISGTITPNVGWNEFPASCPGGLHMALNNTIDATFFVVEGQT